MCYCLEHTEIMLIRICRAVQVPTVFVPLKFETASRQIENLAGLRLVARCVDKQWLSQMLGQIEKLAGLLV
jgi:hypothetical protein